MGEPRRWVLERVSLAFDDAGEQAITEAEGPPLAARQRVPVIEAVLTDELVEKVARDGYAAEHHTVGGFDWDSLAEASRDRERERTVRVLLAAGFQEPGGSDGH